MNVRCPAAASEEEVQMEFPPVDNGCSSQILAAMLLDAWLSGDRCRLLWEVDRTAALRPVPADGAECDRMEILAGIAYEMASADLFAPRTENARIGVWMDLLDHLADRGEAYAN